MGGKLAVRPFDLCSYRMTLFESVFTRGGQSEPDDPVNQAVTRREHFCVESDYDWW